jgi:hypothetical protein
MSRKFRVGEYCLIVGNTRVRHYLQIGTKVEITQTFFLDPSIMEVKGVVDPKEGFKDYFYDEYGRVQQLVCIADLAHIPKVRCNYDKPGYRRPFTGSYRRFYVKANPKLGLLQEYGLSTPTDRVKGREIQRPKHMQIVYLLSREIDVDDEYAAQAYERCAGYWFYYKIKDKETGEERTKLAYGNAKRFRPLLWGK